MSPPGLQIYLWPRMTLTFDLMTPTADHYKLPRDRFCQFAAKSVHLFSKNHVHKFCTNRWTDKQMNAHCLHLPVWPDGEVICLNIVSTASPLVIILALKGKRKGLDTCYSATYMSQTRDQQCFTISEVAADWHEPMVPQRIMWQSIACANGRLDPPCSKQTHHRPNQPH